MNNTSKLINFLTAILIAVALFYFASRTFVDPDLWWHLKCGIEIYKTHAIAPVDPYSFLTFDWRWINEEWLFQLIIASVYLHAGWCGLVIFKALICVLIILPVYIVLRELKLDIFGTSLLLLSTAILLSPATNSARPHIITCLFTCVLLFLLRKFPLNSQYLILLPLMFLFWINIHGGFIVGILTLLVYSVLYTVTNRNSDTKKDKIFLWSITTMCCIMSFINPYGFALPARVIHLSGYPHPDVSEWQPIEILHGLGPLWVFVIVISVYSLIYSKENKNIIRLYLWLPFAIAPLVSMRHIVFLGLATVLLIGEHIAYVWNHRPNQPQKKSRFGLAEFIFAILCITISAFLIRYAALFYAKPQVTCNQDIPDIAAGIIKKADITGDLLLNFDWGGYAIWHLYPKLKVSFDGRREWAYSPTMSVSNMLFTAGEGPWDIILSKYPVAAVLISTHLPGYNLMKLKPGWCLAYADETAAIFLPQNSPKLEQIKSLLANTPKEKRFEELALPLF